MLKADVPLRLATEYYAPFSPGTRFEKDAYSLADIEDRDWEKRSIPEWLDAHGGSISDYRFYLFGARYKYVFLGFRSTDDTLRPVCSTSPHRTAPRDSG